MSSSKSNEQAAQSALRKQRWLRPVRRLLPYLPKRGPFGFLRFGLTQLDAGSLRVGDAAPDAAVTRLDGTRTTLHAHCVGKPLALVFGSFT